MSKKLIYKNIAKNYIIKILRNSDVTEKAIEDIYEINHGNDEVLLHHIKYINGILVRAYNEIKNNKGGGNNE